MSEELFDRRKEHTNEALIDMIRALNDRLDDDDNWSRDYLEKCNDVRNSLEAVRLKLKEL